MPIYLSILSSRTIQLQSFFEKPLKKLSGGVRIPHLLVAMLMFFQVVCQLQYLGVLVFYHKINEIFGRLDYHKQLWTWQFFSKLKKTECFSVHLADTWPHLADTCSRTSLPVDIYFLIACFFFICCYTLSFASEYNDNATFIFNGSVSNIDVSLSHLQVDSFSLCDPSALLLRLTPHMLFSCRLQMVRVLGQIKSLVSDVPLSFEIIVRTTMSRFYQAFTDFTVTLHKCSCVCLFWMPVFSYVLDTVLCLLFQKTHYNGWIKTRRFYYYYYYLSIFLHLHKSKRAKPCIFWVSWSNFLDWFTLFKQLPFFSSFFWCKAAPSMNQHQILHIPFFFAQHLKLIDSMHVWHEILTSDSKDDSFIGLVNTRLTVDLACCDVVVFGFARVEWPTSPCFHLNFSEHLPN